METTATTKDPITLYLEARLENYIQGAKSALYSLTRYAESAETLTHGHSLAHYSRVLQQELTLMNEFATKAEEIEKVLLGMNGAAC